MIRAISNEAIIALPLIIIITPTTQLTPIIIVNLVPAKMARGSKVTPFKTSRIIGRWVYTISIFQAIEASFAIKIIVHIFSSTIR